MQTQILLKFCQALNNSELNESITQHIFEELREVPNKEEINDILHVIDGMLSDDLCSRQHTGSRFNLNHVKDEAGGARGDWGGTEGYKQDIVDKRRPCFVCGGKHKEMKQVWGKKGWMILMT